jgi:hypothetical protein
MFDNPLIRELLGLNLLVLFKNKDQWLRVALVAFYTQNFTGFLLALICFSSIGDRSMTGHDSIGICCLLLPMLILTTLESFGTCFFALSFCLLSTSNASISTAQATLADSLLPVVSVHVFSVPVGMLLVLGFYLLFTSKASSAVQATYAEVLALVLMNQVMTRQLYSLNRDYFPKLV